VSKGFRKILPLSERIDFPPEQAKSRGYGEL
jgi:hypothetical protein